MKKILFSHLRKLEKQTIHRLLWVAAAIFILAIFMKISLSIVTDNGLATLDEEIIMKVALLRSDALNGPAVDITALGSATLVTLITVFVIVLLLLRKDRTAAFHLFLASAGSGIWTRAIKAVVGRDRPSEVTKLVNVVGHSYPSGHSLMSAALYMTLAFLISRRLDSIQSRVFVFGFSSIITIMVASSRVYLGVHYPSDAFSGILFGSSWAILLATVFTEKYQTLKNT